jgi:SAM-dependent methyltransferase
MANSFLQKKEEIKLQKELACYEQNYEQFRTLNQQMWQIPVIAMTLTGGLWYGIISLQDAYDSDSHFLSVMLFTFAAVSNFSLTFVLGRIRKVMDAYLDKIELFYKDSYVSARPSANDGFFCRLSVHRIFRYLLIFASILSIAGAVYTYQIHKSENMTKIVDSYNLKADELAKQYESVSFEEVHSDILDLLPKNPSAILDVGGGTGRDAAALAKRDHTVYVAEPAEKMRELGKQLHSNTNIRWVSDSLPKLDTIKKNGKKFDFILVSAVWMHIPPDEQEEAFSSLQNLLNQGGILAISFRSGITEPNPLFYQVDSNVIKHFAKKHKLKLVRETSQPDKLHRGNIFWTTLVLKNE